MSYLLTSADDHLDLGWLPADLWTTRLAPALRERGPHLEQVQGRPTWVCDGKVWGGWGGRPSSETGFKSALERAGAEPGVNRPTIPELRLADMDRDGVETTVMYGPILTFQSEDAGLRHACYRAYNEWLVDFCAADPRRLVGVAQLPVDDPGAAKEELEFAAKLGLKQVNLLVAATTTPVFHDVWDPFWSAAADTGVLVSFHVGGNTSPGQRSTAQQTSGQQPKEYLKFFTNGFTRFIEPITGLLTWGVLERHPKARLVLAETGVGWLPFALQNVDFMFGRTLENRAYYDQHGGIDITVPPSEVFHRQVWMTFQEDQVALALIPFLGEDHLMWASDYPHPGSTYPNSQAIVDEQMRDLSPTIKKKVVRDNARVLYGLE